MTTSINDTPTERAILSIIARVGWDAYIEVSDILNTSSFTINSNQALYKVFKHILEKDKDVKIDFPSVISGAKAFAKARVSMITPALEAQ